MNDMENVRGPAPSLSVFFNALFKALLPAGALLAGFFCLAGCEPEVPASIAASEDTLPERVDFNFHVKPILSDRCFPCHGPDDNARATEFRLDTEEGAFLRLSESRRKVALAPGSLKKSEIFHRLISEDPDYRMPPAESNLHVTPEEAAIILKWIEQGAEYKPHWAFIPPVKPDIPDIDDPSWPRNGVDRFILARLEREGLRPSAEATKETLLRRVTFDLTGLPPTLEEIDAFLTDTDDNAYEKVVDRLLASPAYGERMATEWLDVARYADSHGYQDDGLRSMWPWRDWVIEAFNENLPFDEFVTWQLAGDLYTDPTVEQRLATGFNRNHLQSQEGGIVLEEYRIEYVADRTNTFGTAFLGLTMECARCHDHKFDPVSQREYYQLFDFFNSVNESGSSPYSGVASPTVILEDDAARDALVPVRAQIAAYEEKTAIDHTDFDEGFERWLAGFEAGSEEVAPQGLVGHYPLEGFDLGENDNGDEMHYLENRVDPDAPGFFSGDIDKIPVAEPGRFDASLALQGDGFLDMGADRYYFERNEPFSVGLWFRVIGEEVAGPLFTRTAGLFTGRQGYLCVLEEDGTVSASLNHVYPDNSIRIQSLEPVPAGQWSHIAMTYDGSSRADGLALYLDGERMATEVKVDNLKQSIQFPINPTTGEFLEPSASGNLRIGFLGGNAPRLDSVAVDEFRIYDRRLTALEVAAAHGTAEPADWSEEARRAALRDYYVTTASPQYARDFAALTEARGKENEIMSGLPEVMAMRDLPEPRPTYMLDRGQYDAPTVRVERATPISVLPFSDDLPRNRMGLAQWLTDPGNPLFARVTVNRYWQLYFGNGLVSTPDDFGSQGALPTHPELLDWLAVAFVDMDWDVKALQKLIVTSAAYRQRSVAGPDLLERDPDNTLLARGPNYRMPAEMIRDHALAASGLLVDEIGGPPVRPYQPAGLWKELATRNATEYKEDEGDNLYRRSMYTIWKRTTPPPSMMNFDASERNICTVRRQSTSTPLQALVLLNDPQYVEASRLLAERLLREEQGGVHAQIAMGYRLLTSRLPDAEEVDLLAGLYEEELQAFASDRRSALDLLAVGEQPRDERLDPAQLAALTVVANTMMNFDEAVIKR